MIHLGIELNGKPMQIRDIEDVEVRNELDAWRLRIFDALLVTPCPICKTSSRATIVLISDKGKQFTRIHTFCHQEFVDSLQDLLPEYLTA
ncbi:MAG: hypothetical protein WCT99_05355 [Bacteroidota bacterium]|jgi:hypothetical protein